jgi:PAS domain-containing protein
MDPKPGGPHTNAFPLPEVDRITKLAQQISLTLERIFKGLMLDQVVKVFPDAILIVSPDGTVLNTNLNARKLLEIDTLAEARNFSDYLDDEDEMRSEWDRCNEPHTTTINGSCGTKTRVLLQSFTLPDKYDHVIVRLQKIVDLQWATDLERLKLALAEASIGAGSIVVGIKFSPTNTGAHRSTRPWRSCEASASAAEQD